VIRPTRCAFCLGGPLSRTELRTTRLRLIAATLDHPLHPHATVM